VVVTDILDGYRESLRLPSCTIWQHGVLQVLAALLYREDGTTLHRKIGRMCGGQRTSKHQVPRREEASRITVELRPSVACVKSTITACKPKRRTIVSRHVDGETANNEHLIISKPQPHNSNRAARDD